MGGFQTEYLRVKSAVVASPSTVLVHADDTLCVYERVGQSQHVGGGDDERGGGIQRVREDAANESVRVSLPVRRWHAGCAHGVSVVFGGIAIDAPI